MASEHSGIQLFLSNRLENLADALVKRMTQNTGNPLAPDTILIQNRGMARWLNLRIADLCGIQMNTRFVYPRALIEELLDGTLANPADAPQSAFSQDLLFWRIYKTLPQGSTHPVAHSLRRFLHSSGAGTEFIRRYQLASKISQHIDQLQIYRPDLLRKWATENESDDWRSVIWKSLCNSAGEIDLPRRIKEFSKEVQVLKAKPPNWPDQLHLFAISSLPPAFLDLLKTASRWIPVSVYLTQPSPLYWGDQLSKKKLLKSQPEAVVEDPGHALLGNLGKQGQDFLNTLIDAEVFAQDESELFEAPENKNLLFQLQSDLYKLSGPQSPKPKGHSLGIQIRVCHSEKREIEVLKDELLRCFEKDPDLTPDQVVIMAPNIETYAASIRSVFGRERSSQSILPYSIADYSTRSSSSVAHALLTLFDLLESRFGANGLMNFISMPSISDGFGFSQENWQTLRTWIEDTGIRWGIDEQHREHITGVGFEHYAWQPGIDRLLSGSLIHPDEDSDWVSFLPHPHMEGSSLELLNRFLELWHFLKEQHTLASQTLPFSTWLSAIRNMVEFLFTRLDSQLDECESLFDLLAQLSQEVAAADADELCTLKVIRSILEDRLSKDIQAGSFFSGNITFCSMMPMRNVPAKFIGLIGMQEDAYPRQDLRTEFNQFPDGRRFGDRSRREDDRYLFLESLLAARNHLYISYSGIDSQSLTEEPASIVVEELLDTLDEYYQFPDHDSARKALVSKESLQAFNPVNFAGTPPRSYSDENLDAALALTRGKRTTRGLDLASIPTESELPETVRLEQFLRFFLNPCQHWISERMETTFPFQTRSLEETEPLESSNLQDYLWGSAILENPELLSANRQPKLDSLFPVGSLGETTFQRLAPPAAAILDRWNEIPPEDTTQRTTIDQSLDRIQLTGSLEGASDTNFKRMRFGNIRSVDLLTSWINHLALCCIFENRNFKSHLIGRNDTYSFVRPDAPRSHLIELEKLFLKGHSSALPFFVDTSFTFAKATLRPSPRARKAPIDIAFSVFTKQVEYPYLIQGEFYNRFIQLCFPDHITALSDEFETVALNVFTPLVDHLEGGTL